MVGQEIVVLLIRVRFSKVPQIVNILLPFSRIVCEDKYSLMEFIKKLKTSKTYNLLIFIHELSLNYTGL